MKLQLVALAGTLLLSSLANATGRVVRLCNSNDVFAHRVNESFSRPLTQFEMLHFEPELRWAIAGKNFVPRGMYGNPDLKKPLQDFINKEGTTFQVEEGSPTSDRGQIIAELSDLTGVMISPTSPKSANCFQMRSGDYVFNFLNRIFPAASDEKAEAQ